MIFLSYKGVGHPSTSASQRKNQLGARANRVTQQYESQQRQQRQQSERAAVRKWCAFVHEGDGGVPCRGRMVQSADVDEERCSMRRSVVCEGGRID